MKKIPIVLFTMLLLMTVPGLAAPKEPKVHNTEVRILITRIGEIEKMDKSNLDHEARNELREEVKSIQEELRTLNNGGVYVSVGALIIIILLLIILL